MKRKFLSAFFALLLFCSFSMSNTNRINWKKIGTSQEAWAAMANIVHSGDDLSTDQKLLEQQKHSFIGTSGDTTLYFHSPEISVHFGAWVTRKWMYTFHYVDHKMDNFTVEEGLTGP